MAFHLLGIAIGTLKLTSYEDLPQPHSGAHYVSYPSTHEVVRVPEYAAHRPANMTISDHHPHPHYFDQYHPAEYQAYVADGHYVPCQHCGDPLVGGHDITDDQARPGGASMDDAWRYDRSMCASPSECTRISRFPSPPGHPFDPFYEMKVHAVECMLNSPSHCSSTENSSADEKDETPCRHEEGHPFDDGEPGSCVPRKYARQQWPSPPGRYAVQPLARNGQEYANEKSQKHPDEFRRANSYGMQSKHHATHHEGSGCHHELEFTSEPSYHPGVGYFQLPDSFVQQFAV